MRRLERAKQLQLQSQRQEALQLLRQVAKRRPSRWSELETPQVACPLGVLQPSAHLDACAQDPDFRIAQRTLGVAMTQAQIDQVYRSSMELDAPWIERQRVDYRFWSTSEFTTMWSTLWAIASQPFVERFCVGVSTSASWLWSRCEGHGSMEPHRYCYDVMYVISANYGDAACAMERLLQAKIAETHTQQCVHGGYKRGPVRSATKNIIYVLSLIHI